MVALPLVRGHGVYLKLVEDEKLHFGSPIRRVKPLLYDILFSPLGYAARVAGECVALAPAAQDVADQSCSGRSDPWHGCKRSRVGPDNQIGFVNLGEASNGGSVKLGEAVGKILHPEHPGIHRGMMEPAEESGELEIKKLDFVIFEPPHHLIGSKC